MPSPPRASDRSIALWILAVVALLFFLRAAAQLLIPIALGVLISYALEPVVAWMERQRVPRLAGASLVLLLIVGAGGWGLYSLKDNVVSALDTLPEVARRARELVTEQAQSGPTARIQEAAGELRTKPGESASPGGAAEAGGQASAGSGGQASGSSGASQQTGAANAGAALPEGLGPPGMMGMVQQGVSSIFTLAGNIVVVLFLIFFLLLSGDHLRTRIVEVAGPDPDRQRLASTIMRDVTSQIQRFLLVRLVTAMVVGVATWGVLAWMGVDNAAIWGILAGIFNSIPYFGPVIVSGGLLVVGLVQGGGLVQALQMSGAALVITSIEGWLLTPPLMGKAERMSVIVVFLGLLLWTWVWGAWGTILAVPMLVVIKSTADRVEALKPLGRLMAP